MLSVARRIFVRVTFCCVCSSSNQYFLLLTSGNLFSFLFHRFSLLKSCGQVLFWFLIGKRVTFEKNTFARQKCETFHNLMSKWAPWYRRPKKLKKTNVFKEATLSQKNRPPKAEKSPPGPTLLCFFKQIRGTFVPNNRFDSVTLVFSLVLLTISMILVPSVQVPRCNPLTTVQLVVYINTVYIVAIIARVISFCCIVKPLC